MTMPIDLVLVRHGESEGNRAFALAAEGDLRYFSVGSPFLERHGSRWRLTARGREQARAAGAWIKQHLGPYFDHYFASEYLRAMETAAHLELPDARWHCEIYLRERDWGKFDLMPNEQRRREYAEDVRRQGLDRFFWSPPDGESMATLCLRLDRVLQTLHRECSDKRVVVVCHGEVMWGFRVRLERISQGEYQRLDFSRDPLDKMHNGQVLHYTRRDPETGRVAPFVRWFRSVCPWDPSRSRNEWQPVAPCGYSNEDLLAAVERMPPVVVD
jgi:NAD+ kinase